MDNTLFVKRYSNENFDVPVNYSEVYRYAGYGGLTKHDEQIEKIMLEAIQECSRVLTYKVCYIKMQLEWKNNFPVLPLSAESKNLARCLEGSSEVIIFAATIGIGIDRLISRYQHISSTKALLMQAFGAERVEALCDRFCHEIGEQALCDGLYCTPRFSPGYGDLPLETQRDVFRLLDCSRQIGISLGDSLLMTPSKSVTAIFGLRKNKCNEAEQKCRQCSKQDCLYRT